jgi:hypothetical protein
MKHYSPNAILCTAGAPLALISPPVYNHLWMLKTPLLVILIPITLPIYQRKLRTGKCNLTGFLATTLLSSPFHLFLLYLLLLHLCHYKGLHD